MEFVSTVDSKKIDYTPIKEGNIPKVGNIVNIPTPIDYIFLNSFTKPTLRNIQQHLLYIFEKCPICNKSQNVLYNYQNRVCDPCLAKYYIMDGSNNRLLVGNLGIAGGIQVFQLMENSTQDSGQDQDSTQDPSPNLVKVEMPYAPVYECYIKGIHCVAQECKYGGITLQVKGNLGFPIKDGILRETLVSLTL